MQSKACSLILQSNVFTYLLMFTWYKQLVYGINLLLHGGNGLRAAEHQSRIQEALDQPDVALLLKIRSKLASHHITQQLRGHLWRKVCVNKGVVSY